VFDILKTSHCRIIGGSLTDILSKNPHPDPLPSVGRGKSVYASMLNSVVRLIHFSCLMEGKTI
jgi:hypothetical protein